jgi:hypothetical protein
MEDVGTILMNMYAVHIFAVCISACMTTLVDDQTALAGLPGQVGKGGTKEACADNQVVVMLHRVSLNRLQK